MRQGVIPRSVSAALFCAMVIAPFLGCSGKRVASSSGDAATSRGTSAAPVETIKPETLATVPDDRSASATLDTAREPVPAAPPDSGEAAAESSAPPGSPGPAAARSVESLSLGDVFFDFDQHTVSRDAQSILSANAAWINSKPGKAVVIEGHCDERGTQAYNLVLGDKRARSTKRFLEDLGVPASRLKTTSYGELRPFCKERDESCYQQNRRAHFVIR
jgi:peptidoglycan-associated lipoprotein